MLDRDDMLKLIVGVRQFMNRSVIPEELGGRTVHSSPFWILCQELNVNATQENFDTLVRTMAECIWRLQSIDGNLKRCRIPHQKHQNVLLPPQ
jgi:hypothetical protein